MAYCVRCGVKWNHERQPALFVNRVIATNEVVGKAPSAVPGVVTDFQKNISRLIKSQGLKRIGDHLMIISIIILLITASLSTGIIPLILGFKTLRAFRGHTSYIAVLKIIYTRLASLYTIITIILLLFLEGYDLKFVWPCTCFRLVRVLGDRCHALDTQSTRILLALSAARLSIALFLLVVMR